MSLQSCHFDTQFTAVSIVASSSIEINLRMSQSCFLIKTSNPETKIIYFQSFAQVSWRLWKTEFQLNSYHTVSNDKNFIKNQNKIVSYDPGEIYSGTTSETQYASGKNVRSVSSLSENSHRVLNHAPKNKSKQGSIRKWFMQIIKSTLMSFFLFVPELTEPKHPII